MKTASCFAFHWSFNGAADLLRGATRFMFPTSPSARRLQWGRGSSPRSNAPQGRSDGSQRCASMGPRIVSAEQRGGWRGTSRLVDQASMGPRIFSAEQLSLAHPGHDGQYASMGPRIFSAEQHTLGIRTDCNHCRASMGPRIVSAEQRQTHDVRPLPQPLQWGRGSSPRSNGVFFFEAMPAGTASMGPRIVSAEQPTRTLNAESRSVTASMGPRIVSAEQRGGDSKISANCNPALQWGRGSSPRSNQR